jgi:Phospholipase_D-nuclease N-terminal/Short C-terminal domain
MIATNSDSQIGYSFLWLFLLFIEVWLMISIFIDIFRSHDLRGWQKALWVLLVLILPLVGILAYFVLRGDKMRAHQVLARQDHVDEFSGLPDGSHGDITDQLSRLGELKRDGVITDEEFETLKSRALRQASVSAAS